MKTDPIPQPPTEETEGMLPARTCSASLAHYADMDESLAKSCREQAETAEETRKYALLEFADELETSAQKKRENRYPDESGFWWLYDAERNGWIVVKVQQMPRGNSIFLRAGELSETSVTDFETWGDLIPEPNA